MYKNYCDIQNNTMQIYSAIEGHTTIDGCNISISTSDIAINNNIYKFQHSELGNVNNGAYNTEDIPIIQRFRNAYSLSGYTILIPSQL